MKVLAIILIVIVVLAILYFLMIMPRMIHKPDTAHSADEGQDPRGVP